MGYLGRTPTPSPVTADDIPANSIDASKIVDGSIELAEIADNSITDAKLNSSKLDGIADSANNYSHPSAHTVSEVTGLQGLLDGKVDDSQVLTNVPSGALFTDTNTVYTHPTTHATADIADNAITEAKIADAAVVSLKSGRKNLIINGGFDVWQRGTSFSSNKYTADRWYQWNGTANTTVTQSAIGARITSTSFSGANLLEHRLEGTYTAGKTVTLSVKTGSVCSNAGAMIYTRTTGGSWQYTVISGGLVANTVNTFTGTVPADAGKINIRLANVGSGALDLDVEYAQLEVGSVATDFEHRSYGEELALCQRYYELGGFGEWAKAEISSKFVAQVPFKVPKRTTPSVTLTTTSNVRFREFGIADRDASTCSITSYSATPNGCFIKMNGWSGLTTGIIAAINYTTSTNNGQLFAFDAEL